MADQGRLKDEVALVHHERLALVLVDDANPAAPDVDHLERDAVEVDPVRDRAALGNGDVRSDVAPAEPAWDQVAIEHPRAALAGRATRAGQHEFGRERRQAVGQCRRSGRWSVAR